METKEIKITPPKGYEIDKENSTFECIKFKKKSPTYENIAKELFFHKESFSVDNIDIYHVPDTICYQDKLIAKSSKQLEKLLAINKLMNVAKYLNDCGWEPDWKYGKKGRATMYYIQLNHDIIDIAVTYNINASFVYFESKELAQQAIDILGEETIRLALSTDW